MKTKFIPGVLVGALITALVCMMLHATAMRQIASLLGIPVFGSTAAVVHSIQNIKRLETVIYTQDQAVSGERQGLLLPRFLTGDRILLLVRGEVVAGVDLGKIKEEDVTVSKRTLRLHLPPSEIFSVRIDNEKSRVFSRETGIFTSVDPDLESETRRSAEQKVSETALREGILKIADENARTTIIAMGKGLGFDEVLFR